MISIDRVLIDGKKVSGEELKIADTLADEGLCEISSNKYMKCNRREDDDYYEQTPRDCQGHIPITQDGSPFICPECGRTADRSLKRSSWIGVSHPSLERFGITFEIT